MGNQNASRPSTLTKRSSYASQGEESKLDNSVVQGSSSMNRDQQAMPFYWARLQDEPDQDFQHLIPCIRCGTLNLNYNVEKVLKCAKCPSFFIHDQQMGVTREVEAESWLEQPPERTRFKTLKSIPELETVIISCDRRTLPIDFIRGDDVDYPRVMKNFLLPFLQLQVRLFAPGILFPIGTGLQCLQFKVFSCFPAFGRVSKRTIIKCFDSFDCTQPLSEVSLISLSRLPLLNQREIKDMLRNKRLHLSRDQIVRLDGRLYRVLTCFPQDGVVHEGTVVDILKKRGDPLSYLNVAVQREGVLQQFPYLESMTDLEMANILREQVFIPYFENAERYLIYSSNFQVGNLLCRIEDCSPHSSGLVRGSTSIYVTIGRNETEPEEELKESEMQNEVPAPLSESMRMAVPSRPRVRRFQHHMLMRHLLNGLNFNNQNRPVENPVSSDEAIDAALLLSLLLGGRSEGASPAQIDRLPTKTIDKAFLEREDMEDDRTLCRICLVDYEDGDEARTMPCLHYFHKNCIDVWLSKKRYCPLCKTPCDSDGSSLLLVEETNQPT
eukprot:TRINITY_DN9159_c0_g2_i2.p1 TRINITY_DN9159_c0_g2~~TRINITY_DN9159_c0_g2_i2.p1  ORF type:complete len:553 (-),score=69.26 TRINITY_DN9159_c0_g2_i2:44-1702(-)